MRGPIIQHFLDWAQFTGQNANEDTLGEYLHEIGASAKEFHILQNYVDA